MTEPAFAIIAGGGTAGHVLPALAIAEALVAAGHAPDEIHYVGARRGIETRLLPATSFPHTFLDVVGLQRGFAPRRLVANLGTNLTMVPKLVLATRRAIALARRLRPRVVVSVGGYASLPAVAAARRLAIPIVVVSYDHRPGRASALTARVATAAAVAFPDSPLPRAVVTGAPVRRRILAVDRSRDRAGARAELGLPADRFVLGVTGGSQGSGALNDAVARYVADHAADATLAVRQVVGERFVATAARPLEHGPGATVPSGPTVAPPAAVHQVVGYDERIELLYAAADLLVGRGGASTVAEVAVTGTPAILVPWPGAADDHQTANVAWLADAGAAVLLPEDRLGELGAVIDRLRADPAELARLAARAHAAGAAHRRDELAALIERVAAAGRPRFPASPASTT